MQEQEQPNPGSSGREADPSPPPRETPPPASGGWEDSAAPSAQQTGGGPSGLVYADVPNRAIAYIIDAIILFVINLVVGLIIGIFLPSATINPNSTSIFDAVEVNYVAVLITTLIGLAISGVYFVYTWTRNGGSPGQRMLGMKVSNTEGASLTQDQAIKRWIFLGAPFGLASALTPIPTLGLLISLAGLAYFIYLLVTTAQSPTKQGFHDKQVNSIVVKSARSVG